MANISPDLTWSIVRDTSSYLLRRKQSGRSGMGKRGAEFTTEPNNLSGTNTFKYSGLANAKTIGLVAAEKGVVMTTKSRNPANAGKVRQHPST
jgi:large subunit ribosomal protein L28e